MHGRHLLRRAATAVRNGEQTNHAMWSTEHECPNPPLTDELLANAEAELGVRLPRSYVDALRIRNGGRTVGSLIPLPDQQVPEHLAPYVDYGYIHVDSIAGIGQDGSGEHDILGTPESIAEWSLPAGLVLLDGDGHTWTAFDFRVESDDPPIVFVESDSGDTLLVAANFAELFTSLIPHEQVFDADGNLIT